MKRFIVAVILFFTFVGCAQQKEMDINAFVNEGTEGKVIVDVRTPQEYQSGHLDSAVNINWFDENFLEHFTDYDPAETIYVYCKVGGRSAQAAELLEKKGFKVVNLQGGYDALKK